MDSRRNTIIHDMEVIQKTEYIRAWQQQSQVISFSVAQNGLCMEEQEEIKESNEPKVRRSVSVSYSGVHTNSFSYTMESDMVNDQENSQTVKGMQDIDEQRAENDENEDKEKKGESEKEEEEEENEEEEEEESEEEVAPLPRPIIIKKRRDTAYKFGSSQLDPTLFQNWRRE